MAELTVNGVKLSQVNDEATLSKLINQVQDVEIRKQVRARLQQLKSEDRAKQGARNDQVTDHREEAIQNRQRQAAESKARTLKMYDNMAKTGSAGDHKPLDINTYRGIESNGNVSGTPLQKTDLVEETIRARARACDEHKARLLAAYDYAAKTQPAGTVRDVDFEAFKNVDVSNLESQKSVSGATFEMCGGVPKVVKTAISQPSTPIGDRPQPSFNEVPHMDAYERSLRQRKQQADERKQRVLAAYDHIARSGSGPRMIVQEELEQMILPEDSSPKPKFSCTSSFSGGCARLG